MKPSRFNHFFPVDEGNTILAVNSFTGELIEIEKEHFSRVQELLADSSRASTDQDREFLEFLKNSGFVIPDGMDQVGILHQRAQRGRSGMGALMLTIAPTLGCNFDCPYCFERRSAGIMKEDVQEALIRFTDRALIMSERLRIKWFGGEPTLCMGLIERLHMRLVDLALKRNIEILPPLIVSNGYLLDAAMAQRLLALGIETARVTIDGPQPVHDSRRMLRNGKGTYRRIIENLAETVDILKFEVQINVDKGNVETVYGVLEELNRLGILPKIKMTFAQVVTGVQKCTTCPDPDAQCFTNQEFAHVLVELYRRLAESGIAPMSYPSPLPNGGYCSAIMESAFVVAPNGLLFRCTEELSADPARSIGDVFMSPLAETQRANLQSYRDYDPYGLPACQECSLLPVCVGGCPLYSKESAHTGCGRCVPWKFNYAEMIELYYRASINQADA